jgi:ADP-ribose pyrophosphatase YjhB (NUDIX family)
MAGEHYADSIPALPSWIADDVYAAMLDTVVLACVDVLVRDPTGQVLLGLRSRDPHPDWWLFGGRMRRGESFLQAAATNLKRELGLTVAPERFRYVASYSTVFSRRAQAPAANGVHTVNAVCELVLDPDETATLIPDSEYLELAWRSGADVRADERLHPLLAQALLDAGVSRQPG